MDVLYFYTSNSIKHTITYIHLKRASTTFRLSYFYFFNAVSLSIRRICQCDNFSAL